MKIEAVIFDLDGTIFDSLDVWRQIDIEFMENRGLEATPDYMAAISLMGFREAADYTIERFGLEDTAEKLMQEWNDMAAGFYGSRVTLKKNAKEYIQKMAVAGFKLGVATSLPPVLYRPALEKHGLVQFFHAICSTSEVSGDKESSEIYVYTAERLNVNPKNCLVFEDTLQGIRSAKKAGMYVYAVLDEAARKDWQEISRTANGVLHDFQNAPVSFS